MRRMYQRAASEHFRRNRQMLFVMGPRQVGKTTIGLELQQEWPNYTYLTWDNSDHRKRIKEGEQRLGEWLRLGDRESEIPLIVFDELHKHRSWKNFLKGFYDTFPSMAHIMVTGSARLDVYQKGADSLMGRYFRYRVHPLTIREITEPDVLPLTLRPEPIPVDMEVFDALWRFGGFPDPFIRADDHYSVQWRHLRAQQLFREDLRDLSQLREIAQLEILAEAILHSIGSQISYSSLSRQIGVSHVTIKRWLKWLTSLYYCFEVTPWAHNLARALTKEPKYYMTDWSMVKDPGARAENMVASHLLKAVHFWTDCGTGIFSLHYVRDRHKREVDFLIARDGKPWCLVEVKLNHNYTVSSSLRHFQQQLETPFALQAAFGLKQTHEPCFLDSTPRVVPAVTLLSQLA